jgi:spore maturation protein CgeB
MVRPSVLIVGPSQVGQMAWFVRLASDRLGWQTRVVDNRAFMRRGLPGRLGAFIDRAEGLRQQSGRHAALQRRIVALARTVDLVLVVKGEHVSAETVSRVSLRTKIVNWHPDHPVFETMFDEIGAYTVFCPKDTWTERQLIGMGYRNVVALPHATDVNVLGGAERMGHADVSVLGSIYPYRRFWIRRAVSANLSVRVWGGRVTGLANVHSDRAQAVGVNQGRAFRAGSVTLNTHCPLDIAGANQRLFDAAGAGVAQLTEVRGDSCRYFGSDCIATFSDADEFDEELARLMKDQTYRESLARAAQRVVAAEHSYEHRLRTLADLLWA